MIHLRTCVSNLWCSFSNCHYELFIIYRRGRGVDYFLWGGDYLVFRGIGGGIIRRYQSIKGRHTPHPHPPPHRAIINKDQSFRSLKIFPEY